MINPIFTNKYNEEAFAEFIQEFIPQLSLDKKRSETRTGFKSIQQIAEASENNLDLVVFMADIESSLHARIEIIKNTYAVLKSHARSNALVAYISDDSSEWRLSLVTTKVTRTKDGIRESVSNPRRFSYVLGPSAKVATPSRMLQGSIDSITDLENKFSLAVVSKDFFTQIVTQYSKLVGGKRGEGRKAVVFERTLKLGDTNDAVNANFAIRLIGRLVFCWFLKQKKGHLNNPLIPSDILSVSAVKNIRDYYHSICVPLFFEVLNKPQSSRPIFFSYAELFDKVPFLNGGLFQDHTEDNHKFNRTTGMSERRGVVNVPDVWFSELFQIFEEYNFTIDENTSIDTELSIDPEMLGRIFENLLAEVNPETGASARKSTGSFYTPREIVDFMVEESLVTHLKTKTKISEEKIRALSSYDLADDVLHPIDPQEQKLLVEAIHNTTVLDPACGSGAFPIGVLQRLVHMLGVLDPDCSIYLNKLPPEIRRQLQKHSLTYVRKLGVIRECIHGVDIQPIAIDISRLRCFLTLVVDQRVDDNAPNRGIEPLPNLDFKFVCANTLIKPPVFDSPLFGDDFADALGELIDEYFAPVDQLHKLETARKLQQLISDKTKKELESILKSYSHVKEEKYKKVLAQRNEKSDTERLRINNLWGSYENIFQNKPVGFFDTRYFFPIVFRNGGFDVVIANPPYISAVTMARDKFQKEYFKKAYPLVSGSYDIYILFLLKAMDLLNKTGAYAWIIPNKFSISDYAKKCKEFLIEKNGLTNSIDVSSFKVFEETGVYPIIILGRRGLSKEYKELSLDKYEDLGLRVFQKAKELKQHKTFKECGLKLYSGTTGFQAHQIVPFIEVEKTLNSIPFIVSGSVDRYFWSNENVRYMNKSYNSAFIKKNNVIADSKWQFWNSPKIIIAGMTKVIESVYSLEPVALGVGIYGIYDFAGFEPKCLNGLLNSKYMTFYFQQKFKDKHLAGGYLGINKSTIEELPLVDVGKEEQKKISDIVDKILTITKSSDYLENPAKKEKVKEYERQIDQMVYDLYGLTKEEVKIVEDFSKHGKHK